MEKQIEYESQEIAKKIEQIENAMKENDEKIEQLVAEIKKIDNEIAQLNAKIKKNKEDIKYFQDKRTEVDRKIDSCVETYSRAIYGYHFHNYDDHYNSFQMRNQELYSLKRPLSHKLSELEKNYEEMYHEQEKQMEMKKEKIRVIRVIQEENKKASSRLIYEKQRLLKQELLIDQLSPKIREILGMADEDSNYDFELRHEDPDNKLYKVIDYEFNFLFLSLLKKAPIMCEEEILSIVIDYIKFEQKKKVRELLSLDTRLLNNKEFLSIINSTAFCFTREIFLTPELVNRSEFMDYFIQMVSQRQCDNTQYFASGITYGLNCHLDYDLAIYLGRFKDNYNVRKMQKKYMRHRKLFHQISKIKNDPKKQDLLEWLFGLDDVHLTQLEKFCQIPEVSKQLLDNESLYYQVLMSSTRRDWNRYGFCEPEDLFEVNYEVWDHNLDGMMHYFDSFIKGHYIYFFHDGAVHQVPILSYYRNCKQKVEKFMDYIDITCGSDHDITPTEMAEVEEKYADVLSGFYDICVRSLIESMDETLEREEMDEWDHLLELAPTVVEDDEFSKMKIYY